MIAGGGHVPIRRAETGDHEEVAALAQKLGDDGAAMQEAVLRDHRGFASSFKIFRPEHALADEDGDRAGCVKGEVGGAERLPARRDAAHRRDAR